MPAASGNTIPAGLAGNPGETSIGHSFQAEGDIAPAHCPERVPDTIDLASDFACEH